jgi:NTP pyrophosphatase (non-canonical NTP hydrolase)
VTKLTDAELERLALLGEECGEVQHMIGKVIRHGYDNAHKDYNYVKNRDLLRKEVMDLMAVVRLMFDTDIEPTTDREMNAIIDKKNQYLRENHIECI